MISGEWVEPLAFMQICNVVYRANHGSILLWLCLRIQAECLRLHARCVYLWVQLQPIQVRTILFDFFNIAPIAHIGGKESILKLRYVKWDTRNLILKVPQQFGRKNHVAIIAIHIYWVSEKVYSSSWYILFYCVFSADRSRFNILWETFKIFSPFWKWRHVNFLPVFVKTWKK